MKSSSIARLLRPRSVAIIGAAPAPSIAGSVLANLEFSKFPGPIHLVSRSRPEINGRKCLASIEELPAEIDVVILVVPAAAVLESLTRCVAGRDIGGFVVFASGFAEESEEGRSHQDKLAEVVRNAGAAMDGPNCAGLVNYVDDIPLTFDASNYDSTFGAKNPSKEGVGIIAQSGAMTTNIWSALGSRGIAATYAISTGNEAVTGVEDFLEFLITDEHTRSIVIFAEQIRRPRQFLKLVGAAREAGKPIVLMHPGRTARAKEAAQSHTGALAGDYAVMRTILRHEGVALVDTYDEMLDVAALLTRWPRASTSGAMMLTNSGAMRGIALDYAADVGLDLPMLAQATKDYIQPLFPSYGVVENPLDIMTLTVTKPELWEQCGSALLADPHGGSLILALNPGGAKSQLAKGDRLLPLVNESQKPCAFVMLGDAAPLGEEFVAAIRATGAPLFRSVDRALRAMAQVTAYGRAVALPRQGQSEAEGPKLALPGSGVLPEYQGKKLLAACGIRIPEGGMATSVAEAEAIAGGIGYPVVLKAQAGALSHKSDAGGVVLNLGDSASLRAGWDRLHANIARAQPGLALDGVLVEKMEAPGLELIVGAKRDAKWGSVLIIGLGGIWAEALEDIRLVPVDADPDTCLRELRLLKGARLLDGMRGSPKVDQAAIVAAMMAIGRMMRANPELEVVEINPLVAHPEGRGVLALDALVVAD